MLRDRTVFVVGAGASAEFGLPIGSTLAKQISNRLNIRYGTANLLEDTGDHALWEAIRSFSDGDPNRLLRASWLIRDGIQFAYSIDNFIDNHKTNKDVELCGKLAIAKSILDAEKSSQLYVQPHQANENPASRVTGTWLTGLMRVLQNGVPLDKIDTIFEKCAFIVFNYDRCIEHFFLHALQALYGIDENRASQVVSKLEIHHPYGSVGSLPWQQKSDLKSVSFGARDSASTIRYLWSGIKTYTEKSSIRDRSDEIPSLIDFSQTVVFLGFSYLPQNMDLLISGISNRENRRRILGTGLGLSGADKEIVSRSLQVLTLPGADQAIIEDLPCNDLISAYSRYLGS